MEKDKELYEFQCAMCKQTLFSDDTEEERRAEFVKIFGKELLKNKADLSDICGDCYKIIDPETFPEKVEASKRKYYKNNN